MNRIVPIVLVGFLSFSSFAAAAPHGPHADIVREAKAQLVATGTNIEGPCGALAIVERAARMLTDGAGLLIKPSGNNCRGFATDIIAYPDGQIYDVLTDGGGMNGPAWNDAGTVEPSRYFAVGSQPQNPPIPPPGVDLSEIYRRLDLLAQGQQSLYQQAERIFAEQEAQAAETRRSLAFIADAIKTHDERPNPILEVLKDRATIVAIITALASWQITK